MARVRRYLNRENAWQNGTRDANLSAVVQELEESVRPEKQLCDDEVRSSIHLLLQVSEVLLVALCFRVSCGISLKSRHISTTKMISSH